VNNNESDGGGAFPFAPHGQMHARGGSWYAGSSGMTLRQYAAIKLKAPDSGTDWLDEMIRESLRAELAARAMQGCCARSWPADKEWDRPFVEYAVEASCELADAMLEGMNTKARNRGES
jgi:hypothetical protein